MKKTKEEIVKPTLTVLFMRGDELTAAERKEIHAGDIRLNMARCRNCGDIIRSRHVHDFVRCKCGALAVDGGSFYAKRCGDVDNMEELSVMYKDAGK